MTSTPSDFEIVTTTVKLSRPLRRAIRKARLKSFLRLAWIAAKANPRHPIKTYRDYKRVTDSIRRDFERTVLFGESNPS